MADGVVRSRWSVIAVAAQLIPLSAAALADLSPRALDIYRQRDLATAVGTRTSFPISIDQRQTLLSLLILGVFTLLLVGTARMLTRHSARQLAAAAVCRRRRPRHCRTRAKGDIQRQVIRLLGARPGRRTVRSIRQPEPFRRLDAHGAAADRGPVRKCSEPKPGRPSMARSVCSGLPRRMRTRQSWLGLRF